MTFKEWQEKIHQLAKEKGWYDSERSAVELHALMISEIAEAIEAVRAGKPAVYVNTEVTARRDDNGEVHWFLPGEIPGKPEGEATELADCVIRILDYFELRGWDLEAVIKLKHAYNETRSYRHGGKKL